MRRSCEQLGHDYQLVSVRYRVNARHRVLTGICKRCGRHRVRYEHQRPIIRSIVVEGRS